MPYLVRKQKCEQADGDAGTHVIYKKKRDGSQGEKVGCTTDPEQYKKALYAAEGGYIKEIIREEFLAFLDEKKKKQQKGKKRAAKKAKRKKKKKKKKSNKICPKGIAWAKRTFDTYPSAYANLAASKYCKDPNYAKADKKKNEGLEEGELAKWLGDKWVRITTTGNIAGPCAGSKDKKNPDRCLPKRKAQSMTKAERAATARKKKAAQKSGKDSGKTSYVKNTKKGTVKSKKNEILQRLRETLDSTHSAPFVKKADLSDNPYRPFSDKYYEYVKDQRSLWREGKLQFTDMDEEILRSDLGEFAMYEGEKVPLDMPMPIMEDELEEAEYKGRDVDLNSPTRSSGPKKYKVYVKNEKGNVVQVNFGDAKGGLKTNIDDPGARKSFVARHKCKEDKPRTSPGYWSCRIPQFSEKLGMKKMSYRFW